MNSSEEVLCTGVYKTVNVSQMSGCEDETLNYFQLLIILF